LKKREPTEPYRRGNVYWWKKRIPKELQEVYARQGFKPDHIFQKSLRTTDKVLAHLRCIDWDNWLWAGGDLSENTGPTKAEIYERVLREYAALSPDPVYGVLPEFIDETTLQEVTSGQTDPRDLGVEDQAKLGVMLEVRKGYPRPEEFMYSLKDCARDYRARHSDEVTPKTMDKFDRAVTVFLAGRHDAPIGLIRSPEVVLWLDSIKEKAYGTRKDYLVRLAALFTFARAREHVAEDKRNPFEDHKLGKNDKKSTQLMTDEQLLKILDAFKKPIDRLPAIIARHTGMRLGEVFHATLDTIDGVLCFVVKECKDDEWTPKTNASIREVPVRDSIKELVLEQFPDLNPSKAKAYGNKFGRIKSKVFPDTQRTLVFHSLRKTFITFALRKGFRTEHVAHVVGHEEGKGNAMTGRTYMDGHLPDFLKEIIESTPALEGYS
jgi:integrase